MLAVLVLAALTGCGDSPTESFSVVGTWELSTFAGNPLPALVSQSGADKVEIISGRIVLAADGTYDNLVTRRYTVSGGVTLEAGTDHGTYTTTSTSIVFQPAQFTSPTATAVLSGSSFSVGSSATLFVYTKR
jgi:hypothetical protein